MDSYFNQLMEIQNSTDHSFFLLDQDSEPRFVIEADKRTIIIPAEFQFLGVKTDQRSEKIYFEVDRIFDDVDLSTKTCVIQYINAGTDDVDEGIYPVTELDTTTVPGKIVFKWEVDNVVCKYAGVVAFSVRFYEIDPETKLYTYCWNTIPENLPVLDGLNVSGSVTEDFPTELLEWNSRMAALNTEITNKISTADATMKADLKTAKGYMDGAQAARDGAEEAESRVNKIVAGNEAYTKVESDTMYAKSQVKESERGTSVEVYPEDGSNLAVTAYGFTEQTGSGDPSPSNVRQLTNGGLKLVAVTFDGSSDESWQLETMSGGTTRYYIVISNAAQADTATGFALANWLKLAVKGQTGNPSYYNIFAITADNRLYVRDNGESLADFKSRLAADPLTVWYTTTDGTGSLYAPIILQGGEYRATCLPLTAPLCEGDNVVSWVRSGCDKVVTFDGSEDERWAEGSGGTRTQYQIYTALQGVVPNSAFVSDLAQNLPYNASYLMLYGTVNATGNLVFYIPKTEVASLQAWKEYLAAHPLTVWYRSTNYTDAADKPVSLETHQQAVMVLDGTETIELDTIPAGKRFRIKADNISNTPADPADVGELGCSHYKPISRKSTYLGTQGISFWTIMVRGFYAVDDRYIGDSDATNFKAYLAAQSAAGTPVTIVYQLATPLVYAHPAVDIISNIADNGSILISGQKEISASYHKSLDKIIIELDNKSYSKQESHNIFARALRGTAEAAKSITIYPDVGSNVVATIHGFTKQEGSGDASPANVRKLTNGGVVLATYVLDGSADEVYETGNNSSFVYRAFPTNTSDTIFQSGAYSSYLKAKSAYNLINGGPEPGIAFSEVNRLLLKISGITTVDALKAFLKINPLTIWYPTTDGTGLLYVPITGTGEDHTGACGKLTAPLYQGDKLITKIKSGCDRRIVLTGNNVYNVTSDNAFFGDESGKQLTDTPAIGYGYAICERDYQFIQTTYWAGIPIGKFSVGNGLIGFRISSGKSKEEIVQEFNENPLVVWYKSSSYFEENDIPICFESHSKAKIVLNGTENWEMRTDFQDHLFISNAVPGCVSEPCVCDHYKGVKNGWGALKNNEIQTVATGGYVGFVDSRYSTLEDMKLGLSSDPVTVIYSISTPVVYAHDPVDIIANPDEEGALIITGEADGTVSAEYNKDITYAFTELQSAVLAAIAKLSL